MLLSLELRGLPFHFLFESLSHFAYVCWEVPRPPLGPFGLPSSSWHSLGTLGVHFGTPWWFNSGRRAQQPAWHQSQQSSIRLQIRKVRSNCNADGHVYSNLSRATSVCSTMHSGVDDSTFRPDERRARGATLGCRRVGCAPFAPSVCSV